MREDGKTVIYEVPDGAARTAQSAQQENGDSMNEFKVVSPL